MALAAIILDVDGTLIDSNPLHIEAFRLAFSLGGYTVLPDRIAVEIGKGGDTLVPSILGESANSRDGDHIRKQQPVEFEKLAAANGLKPFPKVRELLEQFRRRGLLIAIATSSSRKQLKVLEQHSQLPLNSLANFLVTSDDVQTSKPAPDLIAAAVDRCNVSAAQCALIGDTVYDATSARHAGVVALGVLCGGNSPESLHRAGMRQVYRDPADLLAHLDEALQLASPAANQLTRRIQEQLMHEALATARQGLEAGEVPIGSVIARGDGTILGRGWNRFNKTQNKTAHAEMVAFADAAGKSPADAKDLILVSTLEPCVMCTGAAMEAAVDTILFALSAPADAGSSRVSPPQSPDVQMPRMIGDILARESLELFEVWYAGNAAKPQARYVRQLLELHGAV
jgi:HAD superfamily hydrolase (TIGR01509 family)